MSDIRAALTALASEWEDDIRGEHSELVVATIRYHLEGLRKVLDDHHPGGLPGAAYDVDTDPPELWAMGRESG